MDVWNDYLCIISFYYFYCVYSAIKFCNIRLPVVGFLLFYSLSLVSLSLSLHLFIRSFKLPARGIMNRLVASTKTNSLSKLVI